MVQQLPSMILRHIKFPLRPMPDNVHTLRMHLGIQHGFITGCNSRNKSSYVKSYRHYRFTLQSIQNIPVVNGQESVAS